MILVTVGTQLPFDRLVRVVDAWANEQSSVAVLAQIGLSSYRPRHMESRPFFPPNEMRRLMQASQAIVAHAGIGTMLSAIELEKPLLVLPREARRGEHRNDHQLDTARYFAKLGLLRAVYHESDLPSGLDQLRTSPSNLTSKATPCPDLIHRIRQAIEA